MSSRSPPCRRLGLFLLLMLLLLLSSTSLCKIDALLFLLLLLVVLLLLLLLILLLLLLLFLVRRHSSFALASPPDCISSTFDVESLGLLSTFGDEGALLGAASGSGVGVASLGVSSSSSE